MRSSTDAQPYETPRGAIGALALAHETRNPANAWLAQHRAAKRAQIQRLKARGWALQYVRGGLGPQDPTERDRAAQALLRGPGDNRVDLTVAYLRGWVEQHPGPHPGPVVTHRYYGSSLSRRQAWAIQEAVNRTIANMTKTIQEN